MGNQTRESTAKPRGRSGAAAVIETDMLNGQRVSGGESGGVTAADPLSEDKDTLLELFHQMLLIRRFEEKCAESYALGKIGGFCHLYAVMAELFGKASGCSRGKGGSMHLFSNEVNFLGGHAIVGGQIPLATGVAFASKYKETDQVTLCFFGEAAVNQGAFHESLNLAQLWKLPCIYICENNQYGMGTSLERAMSVQSIAQKACAYEIASEFVDGMDVMAMRHATKRAVERARKDYLPTLIEARTYRYMGHSMSDPGNYRTRAEIEKYQERDPIKLFAATLKENDIIDDRKIAEYEAEIKEQVEKAVRFADESPEPDAGELYTNIYADSSKD